MLPKKFWIFYKNIIYKEKFGTVTGHNQKIRLVEEI